MTENEPIIHFGPEKVLKGTFIGHVLHAASGWTGNLLVADAVELKNSTDSKRKEMGLAGP